MEQCPRGPDPTPGPTVIVLGVLALAYQGITYTTREKVVDLGLLKISAQRREQSSAADRRRLRTCRRCGVGHRRSSEIVGVTIGVGTTIIDVVVVVRLFQTFRAGASLPH